MLILKNTPIMIVDSINSAIHFWVEKMNFQKTLVFPEVGVPAFALLTKDQNDIMFQTLESSTSEHPILKSYLQNGSIIHYIDVDSIDKAIELLPENSILVSPKETFYGTKEAVIKDNTGQLIIFAEKKTPELNQSIIN